MKTGNNELYPIFLKLQQLNVLIVGGGHVGLEKLQFMIKSSPNARIHVVSKSFSSAVRSFISKQEANIELIQDAYSVGYIDQKNIVICATENRETNRTIQHDCKQKGILVNVADDPELCDFYLGGIVTKGPLKLAISTNGTSPILAKRMRQLFESVFPDDTAEILENLQHYRSQLTGDFQEKLIRLNELTKQLIQ